MEIDLDGNHLMRLTDSAGLKSDPQWSPNSGMIAFLSSSGSPTSLWTIKADGSGLAMISRKGESVQDFSWDPVGNTMAYDANVNGRWIIYSHENRGFTSSIDRQ